MSNNNTTAPFYKTFLGASFINGIIIGLVLFSLTIGESITDKMWWRYSGTAESLESPLGWLRWILGDMTEATFFKDEIAAVLMIIGVFIAQWATQKGTKWQGFSISYGTGLATWVLLSSFIGLLFSNLMWGWTLKAFDYAWQPTFVAFVSLPASVVLMYGKGWKNAFVGGILGAIFITPLALLLVNYVCNPLGIAGVVGNTLAMAIGTILGYIFIKLCPSIVTKKDAVTLPKVDDNHNYGLTWSIRRVLADFTEAPFFGNEIASIGLLTGAFILIMLNPNSSAYGTGLIDEIIIAQVLTSSIGVLIHRKKYIKKGWYPTYVPLVSVAPAVVLSFGGSLESIILGSVLGAIIAPPLASAVASKVPSHMHPYIGNVTSMAVCTLGIIYLLKFIL